MLTYISRDVVSDDEAQPTVTVSTAFVLSLFVEAIIEWVNLFHAFLTLPS